MSRCVVDYRSVLFAPAGNARLLDKLFVTRATVVVADLEDGVPAQETDKVAARLQVRRWLDQAPAPGRGPALFCRINASDSPWWIDDLALAAHPRLEGVVVPKVADPVDLRGVVQTLRSRSDRDLPVLGGIETVAGVVRVEELVRTGDLHAVYFGAEDFVTDIGGRRTATGHEVAHARSRVVLAARSVGLTAVDQATIAIRDDDACRRDTQDGRDLGYNGKLCLHPRQVDIVDEVHRPSEAELDDARTIVVAAREAAARGQGIVTVAGRMIDAPLVRRAQQLIDDGSEDRR